MESRKNVLVAAGLLLALAGPLNWWAARRVGPSSRSQPANPDSTSELVTSILAGSGPPLRRPADLTEVQDSLAALYGDEAAPLWTRERRPNSRAGVAVEALRQAETDGLVPEDYDAAWLHQQLGALSTGPPASPLELTLFEATLSTELLRFMGDLHRGRLPPRSPRRVGFAYHVDLTGDELGRRLRPALDDVGLEALLADLRPRFPQYARLRRALARYRTLERDGNIPAQRARQIELALERLRWLPHSVRGAFLVANVPAFRLVAFRSVTDESPILRMAIMVMPATRSQTPLLARDLGSVIFRPFWYPPPNIIRHEIVPALARDAGYLAHEQMELVAVTDDVSPRLPPTSENLQQLRSGRLVLRQRPGPHNALGLVKFEFPNDDRVYMHATPDPELSARDGGDSSHGCIRVEHPADLARFVLAEQPGWSAERIAASMTGTRTIRVAVDPPIRVFLSYTTVIAGADETVEFFDDTYGLDARLEQELGSRGPG